MPTILRMAIAPAAAVEAGALEVRAEILKTESRLLWRWGLALAGLLAGVLVAARLATQALTLPIARLSAGTRLLSEDLAYRLAEQGGDELGDLARALNRMAEQLGLSRHQAVEAAKRAGEEREQAARAREIAVLQERNRLAREIHDTLAQGLAGMVLQLEAAEDAMAEGEGEMARSRVLRARQLARESLREARRSVWNLRLRLPEAGLAAALDALAARLQAEGIAVNRHLADVELDPRVAEAVYRVAQEAVANVLRHSRAAHVEIRLEAEGPGLELVVRDDGMGFEPADQEPGPGGGFGLWAMRERVEGVGGQLRVTSSPGAGTEVRAWVPLEGGDGGGTGDKGADRG